MTNSTVASSSGNTSSSSNTSNNNTNNDNHRTTSEFTLTYLASLIGSTFNGNRSELPDFIADCNNAFELASPEQHRPLIITVLSKIKAPAKTQLCPYTFKTWKDLKEKLKLLYQDKKHYVQLMEELNSLKQNPNENVTQYYQRVEEISGRVLSAAQQNCDDKNLIEGKLATIKENALSRFIHHSHPQISAFLRGREIKNLNEAFTLALAEERALNIHKKGFKSSKYCRNCRTETHNTNECRRSNNNNKYCSFCKNNSHNTIDCFKKGQIKTVQVQAAFTKICRYCKNKGHDINECRKLKFKTQNQSTGNKYCANCKMNNHNTYECRRTRNDEKNVNNTKGSLNYMRRPVQDTDASRVAKLEMNPSQVSKE